MRGRMADATWWREVLVAEGHRDRCRNVCWFDRVEQVGLQEPDGLALEVMM